MKRILAILVLTMLSQSSYAEVTIAVVGVGDDMDLVERWASAEGASVKETRNSQSFRPGDLDAVVVAPRPQTPLAQVASLLHRASAAVIVIDATQGPLPVNREHIVLVRQARVPVTAIMLANVDELHALAPGDAMELLKLEEEEVRYLMASYEVDGQPARLFHDSDIGANAPGNSDGGLRKAAAVIAGISKADDRDPPAGPRREARGHVYLLTEAETNGAAASIAEWAPMVIWSEGSSAPVDVRSATPSGPGDVAEIDIRTQKTFLGEAGSRFLLIRNEAVVGIGVLTEVSRLTSLR